MTGHLDDAAFRRNRPAENDQATALLNRIAEGPDHFLARSLLRIRGLFGKRAAGNRHDRPVYKATVGQPLRDHRNATGLIDVHRHEAAGRFQVHQQRRALADGLEIVDLQAERRLPAPWRADAARRWWIRRYSLPRQWRFRRTPS